MERDDRVLIVDYSRAISTHTLTWSVTTDISAIANAIADFNSHAHVERDTDSPAVHVSVPISTHTLTWSVTVARAVGQR